jgi:hypothetical protein
LAQLTIDVFGRGRRVASIYANKLPQDSDFDDIMSELIASMNDDEPADEIELVALLNERNELVDMLNEQSELIASMNDQPADEIELVAPLNEQPADDIHFLREDGV